MLNIELGPNRDMTMFHHFTETVTKQLISEQSCEQYDDVIGESAVQILVGSVGIKLHYHAH